MISPAVAKVSAVSLSTLESPVKLMRVTGLVVDVLFVQLRSLTAPVIEAVLVIVSQEENGPAINIVMSILPLCIGASVHTFQNRFLPV